MTRSFLSFFSQKRVLEFPRSAYPINTICARPILDASPVLAREFLFPQLSGLAEETSSTDALSAYLRLTLGRPKRQLSVESKGEEG